MKFGYGQVDLQVFIVFPAPKKALMDNSSMSALSEEQRQSLYLADSEERNLRGVHLQHYRMSTAQFKKKKTHLDINTW